MNRIELVSHPIRMRLILLLANRTLTTQQIGELLPDVAQTTLYRHINLLLEGGLLTVVRESKVRGTIERELTLVQGAGRIDVETAATLSPAENDALFTTFIALLLADFQKAQAEPITGAPPAFYSQHRLYLTFDELQALNQQMDALLAPYKDASRADDSEARSWIFTGIAIPETDIPASEEDSTHE